MRSVLLRLGSRGPVPVFPIRGVGGGEGLEALWADPRVRIVDTPRAAAVLLVLGRLTERLLPAAMLAHDQVPRPAAAAQWLPDGEDPLAALLPGLRAAGPAADPARAAVECLAHAAMLPRALPDVPPAPWRGRGPYGQGGKGMTGGVPYGRPLPGRADDRDGLKLDRLSIGVGPLHPALPAGLVLSVRLQGDVVQEASVEENAFGGDLPPRLDDAFRRALRQPVPVAELEMSRARHHLRWAAHTLRVQGLEALAARLRAFAATMGPVDRDRLARLIRRIDRTTIRWLASGVGVVGDGFLGRLPGGPVARASGEPVDARSDDPVYRELGFEPVTRPERDARARLRLRLEEAVRSLELAARAGDRHAEPRGEVESPRGRLTPEAEPSTALLGVLPDLLAGQEWGDAVSLVVSLDLDMEEAAGARAPTLAGGPG